jgi:coproporphyrinogen III oxidase-like Fe-S oxidoreductase
VTRGESVREERETLDAATRAKERIMFGLRMREGVGRQEFAGADAELHRLAQEGLTVEEEGRVFLTARGRLLADSVAELFV